MPASGFALCPLPYGREDVRSLSVGETEDAALSAELAAQRMVKLVFAALNYLHVGTTAVRKLPGEFAVREPLSKAQQFMVDNIRAIAKQWSTVVCDLNLGQRHMSFLAIWMLFQAPL